MYQIEKMAAERQRSYQEEASRRRQAVQLRALRRAARRLERAERRMRHARSAAVQLRAEMNL